MKKKKKRKKFPYKDSLFGGEWSFGTSDGIRRFRTARRGGWWGGIGKTGNWGQSCTDLLEVWTSVGVQSPARLQKDKGEYFFG
jgi:hypothetical protein